MNTLRLAFVSCCFLGCSPFAPGTVGTLGGVAIALALAGLSWNIAAFFLLAPRIFSDHWFERGIADFGQGTGVTATGLLLLRMADPYGRSRVMEAFSFKQLVFEHFLGGGLITALSPLLIAGWGLPRFSLVAAVAPNA